MVCADDSALAVPLLERALRLGRASEDREIVARASRALADALAGSGGDQAEIAVLRAAAPNAGSACAARAG